MVVRVDGQLFALPMSFVHGARVNEQQAEIGGQPLNARIAAAEPQLRQPERSSMADLPIVRLRELLALNSNPPPLQEQVLIVGHGQWSSGLASESTDKSSPIGSSGRQARRVALVVDAVVGPEEVVVRTLPCLLRRHQLFAGVTLSGAGQVVLLLESRGLIEFCLASAGRAEPSDRSASRANSASQPLSAPARVLVVDDSLSARRCLSQMFGRWGWSVAEAVDGLEALDLLRSDTYSLVLTDLEMPRLGGLELLAEVKRSRRTREVPVVVMSSRDDDEHRTRAREVGASGYVAKPISASSLTEVLAELGFNMQQESGLWRKS
jgi:CheY-like chemotaxis protein